MDFEYSENTMYDITIMNNYEYVITYSFKPIERITPGGNPKVNYRL